ncbi:glycosyltransferase family 4 protein [Phenylobacterium sp.]|uniref:glycosyltransferase family 4 protein n=1 Tax=Phenylobacterium sp. TaxID=1871053 RepID=UPI0027316538|nr:glycosyltransferase family 4 protein [Phenylobacterium sp.]MDP2214884.1 glycosyltransferase family 4 protein [Phenylobacterium sp.]
MSNAAIYLHPDGYQTDRPQLMGRHSAGESFLRGFLRHAAVDRFHFWKGGLFAHEAYEALISGEGRLRRDGRWIAPRNRHGLSDPGCVFIPSPTIGQESWWRRRYGPAHYSLCGLTHTTATHRAIAALEELLTCPTESWDGLICTSAAVRTSVETQLALIADDLRGRLGATRLPTPQLATIPLGVNGDDFAFDPVARKAWRERLDIPEGATVALYVGRLNAQTKMNPALMAMALEQAAQATGKPVYWIVSGWSANPEAWENFHAATRAFCPSIGYRPVDGREAGTRFSIWSAADLFISFSDNIQETFGLTPAEAMAAGLPCVVTDWDGYRDTVRHGIDGFRIATYAPRPGLGEDLAFNHDNGWVGYDHYVGAAAQMTAMDMTAATAALVALIDSPDLRRQMGAAGRQRIVQDLDWSQVIPRYQAFWGDLAERRAAAQPEAPDLARRRVNPRRSDPFTLFAAYPTRPLAADDRLGPGAAPDWAAATEVLSRNLAQAGRWALASLEECEAAFNLACAPGGATVAEILAAAPAPRRPYVERSLLWLMKFDLLRLGEPAVVAHEVAGDPDSQPPIP